MDQRSPEHYSATVRRATQADAESLWTLIDALAAYEKLEPPDAAAKERLLSDMSGNRPRFEAYLGNVDGRDVGYAFVFETYSSFLAMPTLYLEDIFVLPEWRSRKVGYTLFRAMAAEAFRRGCGRMEWAVLDWNQLAIDFYERLGARQLREWHYYRLGREELKTLAAPQ
jgi:GNAT superfamily N-acetyltransferase